MFRLMITATVLVAFSLVNTARSAEPAYTTVNVKGMCCKGCVQKVASNLYVIRGVREVRCSIEKQVVFVIPQQSVDLSPRAIWEAVEKTDAQPLRLAGPHGTFAERPRF